MPITKGNRAIAARVHVTIVALAARVPEGAVARPRLGATVIAVAPAPAPAMIARPGIAPVAPVLVEIARPVAVVTGARVRQIAVRVIVMTPARPVRPRALRPRS